MTDTATRRRIMVDTQVRPSDVTKLPIINAMLDVPREVFLPNSKADAAYLGANVELGGGRVLLDPRTFAKMLDALNVTNDDVVLDIGCGLGYSAAVIERMAKLVVAVEEDGDALKETRDLLVDHNALRVLVQEGPLADGDSENAPFDAIIIEGGIETLPDAIADQLADGGRIVAIFMENQLGSIRLGYKSGDVIHWTYVFNAGAPILPGFEKETAFAL